MKKKTDWLDYIVNGLWVLTFLTTFFWILDANNTPFINGVNGTVYEPLSIFFTLFASFMTWVSPKIFKKANKKKTDFTFSSNRKILIVVVIMTITMGGVIHFFRNQLPKNEIDSSKIFTDLFPKEFKKDTLFILVTRFENEMSKNETESFGFSLEKRIDFISNKNKIPVSLKYLHRVSPKTIKEAKKIQKECNADLVLWGNLKNFQKDNNRVDFCFKSQPSDTLIQLAGGEVSPEKFDLNYESAKSPFDIEQGDFYVNEKRFDIWLLIMFNIKVGRFNPELYVIDETLTPKQKAVENLEKAILYFNLQNFKKCEFYCELSLKYFSENIFAYFLRGFSRLKLNKIKLAEIDLKIAQTKAPKSIDIYYVLGLIYSAKKDKELAIKCFTNCIKLDSSISLFYLQRGAVKFNYREYKLALFDFHKGLKLKPNNDETYYLLGNTELHLKNYKESIFFCNKAIILNPKNFESYYIRGLANNNLKLYESALQDFIDNSKLNPNGKNVFYNIGFALQAKGDFKKAINYYDKYIKAFTKVSEAYFNRGFCKYKLEEFEESIYDYNQSIKLNPNLARDYHFRALSKNDIGDFYGALNDIDKSIILDSKKPTSFYYRGIVLFNLGKFRKAVMELSKSIEMDSTQAFAYYHRGISYDKIGNNELSLKDLKKAKQMGYDDGSNLLILKKTGIILLIGIILIFHDKIFSFLRIQNN